MALDSTVMGQNYIILNLQHKFSLYLVSTFIILLYLSGL